ncbi:MAG TPA: sigma-70 family RNA polymerase sigma factor [Verrucomicrobiae bacterium]|nr:sigma-70 family RNA polymerase sigma factor [Verrucomicrobiae bacterium]
MIATRIKPMPATVTARTDAELVADTLSGNRDAFAQIVARYQALVCALTYSACGNFLVSEDLAQVTFITAWCELRKLQEPSKLKSWLCGIARNVAHNSRRRGSDTLTAQPETPENLPEESVEQTTPRDHAISQEEEAILWHSLGEMPPIYREPLVLFYRQHQSVAAVAGALDVSEDVVRQRLSRGRAMLAERVNRIVESTLRDTGPTPAFTAGVLAALPFAAVSATTAAVGAAATKSGATAKSAGWLAALGAILTAGVLFLFSVLAFLLFSGVCIGYVMSRAARRSARQRGNVVRFWRMVSAGFLVFVVPGYCHGFGLKEGWWTWLGLLYPFVGVALAIWAFRWWRDSFRQETSAKPPLMTSNKSFFTWLGLGMVIPTLLSVLFALALFRGPLTAQRIPGEEAQKIIAERSDAQIRLQTYKGAPKTIWIRLPENRRRVEFWTPAEEPTLSALTRSGRTYTSFEFYEHLLPMRWLALLSLFLTPIGIVILLGRPWRNASGQPETEVPTIERVAAKSFAVGLALALAAAAVWLGLTTRWQTRFISSVEAQQIILEHKDAQIEIDQYKNGSSDLHITLPGNRRPPIFVAPADESTLALLAEHHIAYRTLVQGPDFGFADPIPSHSLVYIILLTASAALPLWWAVKNPAVSSPVQS